jgi:hypothetical protein
LDLRGRKWQEDGEDCIRKSYVKFALHKDDKGDQMEGNIGEKYITKT